MFIESIIMFIKSINILTIFIYYNQLVIFSINYVYLHFVFIIPKLLQYFEFKLKVKYDSLY